MDAPAPADPRLADGIFKKSLAVKGGMALLKLGIGFWAGSKALIADGVNSLSDVLTYGGSWIGYRLAQSPADDDHHYGHGGFEALTALVLGVLVLAGAGALLWDAFADPAPELVGREAAFVIAAAVVSVALNQWLARITGRAAQALRSPTLAALARDNRSDVLSSGLVVAGAGVNVVGLTWAEPAAAIVIAVMIAVMGVKSARDGLDILLDRVSDKGLRERIRHSVATVPGVRAVHHVRVHPLGREQRVDLDVAVDPDATVAEAHFIARRVEAAVVSAEASVLSVHVGVLPFGVAPERAPGAHTEPVSPTRAP